MRLRRDGQVSRGWVIQSLAGAGKGFRVCSKESGEQLQDLEFCSDLIKMWSDHSEN